MGIFNQIKLTKPKKNGFNLSHERKFSMNMAELVPIMCEEVVPGDKFKVNTEVMMRLAPLVAPVMHRVNVYTHFFFVPNRIIWDEWKDFITGGQDGLQQPVMPTIAIDTTLSASYLGPGTLADYLGVQHSLTSKPLTGNLNALPFRAYKQIYNDYYMDRNHHVLAVEEFDKSSGVLSFAEASKVMQLKKRCWERDYFTSAMADTQRGAEVNLPLGDSAPIDWVHNANRDRLRDGSTGAIWDSKADQPVTIGSDAGYNQLEDNAGNSFNLDNSGHLEADLENATSATINDIRTATRLQRWLERNMRAGSRYIEQILSHFGVKSSDARLQRAEYLGGGKSPVVISEVLQTSETDSSPQANMAGHGIAVGNTHGFEKFFEEHGYVIGIMSVMPKTGYHQGVRRHFVKYDKFDYFWPEFAHLGEQEVYARELYYDNVNNLDESTVFGYQSRYAEYKHIPDSCHGDMNDTLEHWSMVRTFTGNPGLGISFVEAVPTHRIFADTDAGNDKLYVQLYNNVRALRPMPYFGTPML